MSRETADRAAEADQLSALVTNHAVALAGATLGTIVVSLRDIKGVDGRRCAFLGTNYQVKGVSGGVTRELKLLGTLTVWIDKGLILAMTQSGRMTTTGADPASGHPNGEAVITAELKATPLEKK